MRLGFLDGFPNHRNYRSIDTSFEPQTGSEPSLQSLDRRLEVDGVSCVLSNALRANQKCLLSSGTLQEDLWWKERQRPRNFVELSQESIGEARVESVSDFDTLKLDTLEPWFAPQQFFQLLYALLGADNHLACLSIITSNFEIGISIRQARYNALNVVSGVVDSQHGAWLRTPF